VCTFLSPTSEATPNNQPNPTHFNRPTNQPIQPTNQDMIPRMSLWTVERLRDELMMAALRCKVRLNWSSRLVGWFGWSVGWLELVECAPAVLPVMMPQPPPAPGRGPI
jgi:hypothetical protein